MIDEVYIEEPEEIFSRSWGLRDVIYGAIAMLLISAAMVFAAEYWQIQTDAVVILYELLFLVPVVGVMLFKKATWESLGLKRFAFADLLVGFAILFAAYLVILLHNLTLFFFDIAPQGDYVMGLFDMDVNLWALGIAIAIVAPIAEEIFFRSFVYGGLEEKYGWKKAAFISAFIFGAAHMQLVSFIPTFLMGLVFAYLYRRSKSVIPGIILHFMVNGFSFTMILLLTQFSDQLPI